jgi:DNA excision repair protein ERCC-4
MRYYTTVVLLVECDGSRPFQIADPARLSSGDIDRIDVRSRLALLILQYPRLRLIWSRSAQATVKLFAQLKKGRGEPDLKSAVELGRDSSAAADGGDPADPVDAASSYRNNRNLQAIDLLRQLPGVTAGNVHALLQGVGSLNELAGLSESEIARLIGKKDAKLLHAFLHDKKSIVEFGEVEERREAAGAKAKKGKAGRAGRGGKRQ